MTWVDFGGAVVGGAIASISGWFVAIKIFKLERKAAFNIGKKNEIYSPLYTELQQIKDRRFLLPFCPEITIDPRSPWASKENNPHFLTWVEMKQTARHLNVPQELHDELDRYELLLDKYNHQIREVDAEVRKNLPVIRKAHGVSEPVYDGVPNWRAHLVKGELGYDLTDFGMSYQQAQKVFADLNKHIENMGLMNMTKETLAQIETETDRLLQTLERQILSIVDRYEEGSKKKRCLWKNLRQRGLLAVILLLGVIATGILLYVTFFVNVTSGFLGGLTYFGKLLASAALTAMVANVATYFIMICLLRKYGIEVKNTSLFAWRRGVRIKGKLLLGPIIWARTGFGYDEEVFDSKPQRVQARLKRYVPAGITLIPALMILAIVIWYQRYNYSSVMLMNAAGCFLYFAYISVRGVRHIELKEL